MNKILDITNSNVIDSYTTMSDQFSFSKFRALLDIYTNLQGLPDCVLMTPHQEGVYHNTLKWFSEQLGLDTRGTKNYKINGIRIAII